MDEKETDFEFVPIASASSGSNASYKDIKQSGSDDDDDDDPIDAVSNEDNNPLLEGDDDAAVRMQRNFAVWTNQIKNQRSVTCPCGLSFVSMAAVVDHFHGCPGVIDPAAETRDCRVCGLKFKTEQSLEMHRQASHVTEEAIGVEDNEKGKEVVTKSRAVMKTPSDLPILNVGVIDANLVKMFRWQIRTLDHITCPHQECQLTYHSIPGMVRHYETCPGHCQEIVFTVCDVCRMKFSNYNGMKLHMTKSHPDHDLELSTSTPVIDSSSIIPHSNSENVEGEDLVNFAPRACPKEVISRWRKEFSTEGCATCPHERCGLSFTSVERAIEHYRACQGVIQRGQYLVCSSCGRKFKDTYAMRSHISKCHPGEQQQQWFRPSSSSKPQVNYCVNQSTGQVHSDTASDSNTLYLPHSPDPQTVLSTVKEEDVDDTPVDLELEDSREEDPFLDRVAETAEEASRRIMQASKLISIPRKRGRPPTKVKRRPKIVIEKDSLEEPSLVARNVRTYNRQK